MKISPSFYSAHFIRCSQLESNQHFNFRKVESYPLNDESDTKQPSIFQLESKFLKQFLSEWLVMLGFGNIVEENFADFFRIHFLDIYSYEWHERLMGSHKHSWWFIMRVDPE